MSTAFIVAAIIAMAIFFLLGIGFGIDIGEQFTRKELEEEEVVKYYCDKCKNEFSKDGLVETTFKFNDGLQGEDKTYLCRECAVKVMAFATMSDQEYNLQLLSKMR